MNRRKPVRVFIHVGSVGEHVQIGHARGYRGRRERLITYNTWSEYWRPPGQAVPEKRAEILARGKEEGWRPRFVWLRADAEALVALLRANGWHVLGADETFQFEEVEETTPRETTRLGSRATSL